MIWLVNHWRSLNAMHRWMNVLLVCLFAFGVIGLNVSLTRNYFEPLSWFTLLFAFAVLMFTHHTFNTRFVGVILLAFTVGLLVEIAGVKTGFIFGKYIYTQMLGASIFSVPLIIGVNWASLTYATNNMTAHFISNKNIAALVAAAGMVCLDVLIEPLAIKHSFWIWLENGIPPLRNYLGWFATSCFLSFVYQHIVVDRFNFSALIFLVSLVLFLIADFCI